jgi:dolichol-phosphate mannosyltransferase
MQKILALIPVYNEEASIGPLLNNFDLVFASAGGEVEILVVNDGSTDRTMEVVRSYQGSLPLHCLDHAVNGGLGKVIRDGLTYACHHLQDEDLVVTLDGDNSHHPDLIPAMARAISQGSDIVIASRFRPGARIHGLSWSRRQFSVLARLLFSLFAPIPGVRDYTCGYRAYRVSLLKKGFVHYGDRFIQETGFSCMVEILLKLARFKPVCLEFPLILRYDLKTGASKMKVRKTVYKTLALLKDYWFSRRFR